MGLLNTSRPRRPTLHVTKKQHASSAPLESCQTNTWIYRGWAQRQGQRSTFSPTSTSELQTSTGINRSKQLPVGQHCGYTAKQSKSNYSHQSVFDPKHLWRFVCLVFVCVCTLASADVPTSNTPSVHNFVHCSSKSELANPNPNPTQKGSTVLLADELSSTQLSQSSLQRGTLG